MQESLGRKLRIMRAERGLSLREAARRAGVVKETISDIERGQTHPYDVTLAKLAHVYDVPIEELLEEPVPLDEAPQETGPTEAEAEGELRVIPQSAANLQRHIKQIKGLKKLRKAEMEELEKGVGLEEALLDQMELADKGLHDSLAELGVLGFAEAVRDGREQAEPEARPLCLELLRRLEDLEKLSAEARASSAVANANIGVAREKMTSGAESFLAEQPAPEDS
jgi:transcriptional regulator with XRE-family HTH domain